MTTKRTWAIEEQFEKSWKYEVYDTETNIGVARVGYYDTDRAEDCAHARLIAAAPDLAHMVAELLKDAERRQEIEPNADTAERIAEATVLLAILDL